MVEHRTVAPVVAGSIPVTHPIHLAGFVPTGQPLTAVRCEAAGSDSLMGPASSCSVE